MTPSLIVTVTGPVASIGASTVMLTSLPLAIIPPSDTVKLMFEATLLTLITAVSLMLEMYLSSPEYVTVTR